MSGLIGSAVRESMQADYELSALNRSDVVGIPTTRSSLDDLDAIQPAFEGKDAVIHLAAKISDDYGWDDLLATNVVGTRNVFEAAAREGVKRVVFTSSGATVAGWELEPPYREVVAGQYDQVPGQVPLIDEAMPTRPRNLYASTKVWGEAIAQHYVDNHGLEIVCLRIGFANGADRPESPRQFSVWNSQRDVVQAISLAVESEQIGKLDTFFILSNNKWAYRSIERARSVLGYEPADDAENYRL
jgi:nucleoside-diphosphate-sugar epimerase